MFIWFLNRAHNTLKTMPKNMKGSLTLKAQMTERYSATEPLSSVHLCPLYFCLPWGIYKTQKPQQKTVWTMLENCMSSISTVICTFWGREHDYFKPQKQIGTFNTPCINSYTFPLILNHHNWNSMLHSTSGEKHGEKFSCKPKGLGGEE